MRVTIGIGAALFGVAMAISGASGTASAQPVAPTGGATAQLRLFERPLAPPDQADDPTTPEKVALGRRLFVDPILSSDLSISCASCHREEHGFASPHAIDPSVKGRHATRHSPGLYDLAGLRLVKWDGSARSLEHQAELVIINPNYMNLVPEEVAARVGRDPEYRSSFARAFPGRPVDITTVAMALAAYERTLTSPLSAFDRWVTGDEGAVDDVAKRGFALFTGKAGCSGCHGGWRFTDGSFHDIGLPASQDLGRGQVVPTVPLMRYAFKTPGLRAVKRTAPYMHDGSVATLRDAVAHYSKTPQARPSLSSQLVRVKLTEAEISDLVAFLETL